MEEEIEDYYHYVNEGRKIDRMDSKQFHNQYIAGQKGSTLFDLYLCFLIIPVSVLARNLIWVFFSGPGRKDFSEKSLICWKLLLDFACLIIPYILALSHVIDNFVPVLTTLSCISVGILIVLFDNKFGLDNTPDEPNAQELYIESQQRSGKGIWRVNGLYSEVMGPKRAAISLCRGFTGFLSCYAILAVDFKTFSRRHAKTEDFGISLMDTGVAMYVISNALVDFASRPGKSKVTRGAVFKREARDFVVLVCLGLIRLLTVKLSGYPEHVTEYGKHWNFFFTLAVVKLSARIILSYMSTKLAFLFSLILLCNYESFLMLSNDLEHFPLQPYLCQYQHMEIFQVFSHNKYVKNIASLVLENKTGFMSCTGYLSLYLITVYLSKWYRQATSNLWQAFVVGVKICLVGLGMMLFTLLCFRQPSRKLANVSYVAYTGGLLYWSMGVQTCFGIFVALVREFLLTKPDRRFHTSSWDKLTAFNQFVSLRITGKGCVI